MSRIQSIVDTINSSIKDNFYYKGIEAFGVSELILKGEETIPAILKGSGEYQQVGFDFSKFTIYHRVTSIDESDDAELGFGNDSLMTESYTVLMIVHGSQDQLGALDSDINLSVSRQIKTLIPSRLNKSFLDTLQVKTLFISKGAINTDKKSVFATEMPGTAIKINPDNILFSIEYTVSMSFLSSCLSEDCGTTFNLDCNTDDVIIENSASILLGSEPPGETFTYGSARALG